MKNLTDIIVVVILAAILFFALGGARKRLKGGCCGGGIKPKRIKPKNRNTADYKYKATVYIDGMTCEHCKARVENAFNSMSGCYAKVNLKKKCAEVWSNQKMSEEEFADVVEKNGYTFEGYSQI